MAKSPAVALLSLALLAVVAVGSVTTTYAETSESDYSDSSGNGNDNALAVCPSLSDSGLTEGDLRAVSAACADGECDLCIEANIKAYLTIPGTFSLLQEFESGDDEVKEHVGGCMASFIMEVRKNEAFEETDAEMKDCDFSAIAANVMASYADEDYGTDERSLSNFFFSIGSAFIQSVWKGIWFGKR